MSFPAYIVLLVQAESESVASAAAWARFRKDLGIETACLFWTFAEIAILLAVTVLCRVLRERPLPNKIVLTTRERRIAFGAGCFALLIATVVYGRYLLWPPLPLAIDVANTMNRREVPEAVHSIVIQRAVTHYLIWGANLFAWVVLESAIVVQGIRAFQSLARLIGGTPPKPERMAFPVLLFSICVCLLAANASAEIMQSMEHAVQVGYARAIDDLQVVNRFAEFFVRVVSVVWVAVEWVAAIYLIRGVAMLGPLFRERRNVA